MLLTDVDVAIAAVLAAGQVVRRDYGRDHERHAKSAMDVATDTDLAAEQAILTVLDEHRPQDGRTGEESGTSGDERSARRWLIDPLCGTLNFAATTPLVAVNLALSADGQVRVAASLDPISGELFWTDGQAAWLRRESRDVRLEPSAVSALVDINCDGPHDAPFVGGELVADPRLRRSFGPRVISSTLAVARVAAGRRSAYVSDGSFRDNVHFAAGIAVCQAAACVVSDLSGAPLHSGRGLLISADRATHDALLATIAPHLTSVRQALSP